jgi:quinolinate synthase
MSKLRKQSPMATIVIHPAEWKQFQAVAHNADSTASQMVRRFVRDTNRKAAQAAKSAQVK